MTRQADAIVGELKETLSDAIFGRMSAATVHEVELKLKSLKPLIGTSEALDTALRAIHELKKPGADKTALGDRLKSAIWGL